MSTSNNATVPSCSAHVSAGQYSATGQANYNPTSGRYYKDYVLSPQVLPGLIIGVLCWIGAIIFVVWLFTLCCRSVGWRSRRTKTHNVDTPGRNKWAGFHVCITLVTLGVLGSCIWAIVDGVKSTDGQVNEVWSLVNTAQNKLTGVNSDLQSTYNSLSSLDTSAQAAYNLINSNQAAASAGGLNVADALSTLSNLQNEIQSGQSATQEASSNIQDKGLNSINNLQTNIEPKTTNAWKIWRPVAVAVFFGLLIIFGIFTGFLAVLDRTPRTTSVFTLLLLIWVGFVLLFGTGALNLVWRVSRDTCLYGIGYAAVKVGGGANTQVVLDYYFQKTYIAPQDVAQELFSYNLTNTIATINSASIQNLLAELNTTNGQALVATASSQDQTAINAAGLRVSALSANLTQLNTDILASNFADVTNGIQSLICCSITNALWRLWLASTITGALAGLLAVLAIVKVVSAIQPLGKNIHYTPHSPNKIPHGTAPPMKGNVSPV